jgi:hypothetical protein
VTLDIVQVHPSDGVAKEALVRVLNQHHSGKIRQNCLDFYRHDYRTFIQKKTAGGEIVLLVGIEENVPIAVSACAILRKENRAINSLTIVDSDNRRRGIGQAMLSAKLLTLSWIYPSVDFTTYVGLKNQLGVKMCDAVGLYRIGKGTRKREDKKPTNFLIFSTKGQSDV